MTPEETPQAQTKNRRPQRLRAKSRPLSMKQILAWADDHFARTKTWPHKTSGLIVGTLTDTWCAINLALRRGTRGLPGGTTLARLLQEKRGVRHIHDILPLSEAQILAWADHHHARTGEWPSKDSGDLPDAPLEKWTNIDAALRSGTRGLPGGSSLPRLLAQERGCRNSHGLPPYTITGILEWADAFHKRTDRWPNKDDGPIAEAPGETWAAVDAALHKGSRGFKGGSSLAKVLQRRRGVRNKKALPRLTEQQILAWARAHRRRTGQLPNENSGPIHRTNGEVWLNVNQALREGLRGLPGADTLAKLLARAFGVRNGTNIPKLTIEEILAWADAHHEATNRWPTASSGVVCGAEEESWVALDDALRNGLRGLPEGFSLARLLAQHRGVRNIADVPALNEQQILAWAKEHEQRTGRRPTASSGPIPNSGGETWCAVAQALDKGRRGLPGGDSLYQLLLREEVTET
jgi:pyrroloquinoline quinone (PQQ) biosynthesis protein C